MKIRLTKQGRKVWTGILAVLGIGLAVCTEGAIKRETIEAGQAIIQLLIGTGMTTLGFIIMPEEMRY